MLETEYSGFTMPADALAPKSRQRINRQGIVSIG